MDYFKYQRSIKHVVCAYKNAWKINIMFGSEKYNNNIGGLYIRMSTSLEFELSNFCP